jgi:hypothetical protein
MVNIMIVLWNTLYMDAVLDQLSTTSEGERGLRLREESFMRLFCA